MEEDFGRIFYNGKIVTLKNVKKDELEKMKIELKNKQKVEKSKINECFDKMMKK